MSKQHKRYNNRQHIVNITILDNIIEINSIQELSGPGKFLKLEIFPIA